MLKAFLYLHLSIILAGWTGVFGRLIELRDGVLVWYRMAFTMFFLMFFYFIRHRNLRVSWTEFAAMTGTGIILALHWVFFYASIQLSNVSVGVTCYATISFFSALLEPAILKRKFSWADLGFSILTLAGIVLMFSFEFKYRLGISLGVVSALIASLFSIATKSVSMKVKPETLLFYELLGGFIGISLILPGYLCFISTPRLLPLPIDWFYLLCLSLVCTVGLYYFQIKSLQKISAFTLSLSYNLEPVYSILIAILIFHEHREFTPVFYAAITLILMAVAGQSILTFRQSRPGLDSEDRAPL